ncbi:MAG: transcription termination factor NusA [Bdellovibrionota bacterium]
MATDSFSGLGRMIEQIGKEKGIGKQVVIDAIIQGMLTAAKKKYGTYREIEAQYNEEAGEVELFQFKEVVEKEKFVDEEVEITEEDAHEMDPDAVIGDFIGLKLETKDLGRIAAQTARQIITQQVRDAEREIIFAEFENRKGEIASGIVRRVERSAIVVDLGRTEAYIPIREQLPGENYKPGDRVQGYIADVRQTTKGPQIIMSRADERYLVKLFELEVPEIADGVIEIKSAAREPGSRAKIAVFTNDASIDPVGSCVGMKGSRVQNIVQELQGEKIDIVLWDEDVTRFVSNALAPAEVSRIIVHDSNKKMEVVVPDNQLSLAIGKKGQNVRLAAKLSGWKIDIVSENALAQKTAAAIFNLMLIPGLTDTQAQNIYQAGFVSFQDIADAAVAELQVIPGFDKDTVAEKLLKDSQGLLKKYEDSGEAIPAAPVSTEGSKEVVSQMAKSSADQRLKEELAALEKNGSTKEKN